jgi:hypothetical protein
VEREIDQTVDLCLPNGKLNPRAVGWSRFPRHRDNLTGWGRNKRFDYWCVFTPDVVLAFSISDTDYKSGFSLFCLDLATLKSVADAEVQWLQRNHAMSAPWGTRPIVGSGKRVDVGIHPCDGGVRLSANSERVAADLFVEIGEDHESMGVLVPWSDRVFQYTRKDNCLPVTGRISFDGREHVVGGAGSYATMDHGRGRWPYSIVWNWASASGVTDGHEIGLQFGAKWTDGTPSTENSLRIDGRIEKISDELDWVYDPGDWMAPWQIRGSGVEVEFRPVFHRASRFDKKIVLSREDQVFGRFSGTVTSRSGRTYRVADQFGWAEEVHRRW